MSSPQPSDPIDDLNEVLTDAIYLSRRGDRTARQVKTEAHAAIERMMAEVDEKAHTVGFKNGKWATLVKIKSIAKTHYSTWGNGEKVIPVDSLSKWADSELEKLSSLTQNTNNGEK